MLSFFMNFTEFQLLIFLSNEQQTYPQTELTFSRAVSPQESFGSPGSQRDQIWGEALWSSVTELYG